MTSVLIQAYGDKGEKDRTSTGDRTAAPSSGARFPQAAEDKPSPEAGILNGEENTSQMEGKK
jgi:hypothetical protein